MNLEWVVYECGENDIPYDHCIAETPFGRFLITWKGWKENPSYDVEESPLSNHKWFDGDTLQETKQWCEKKFNKVLHELKDSIILQ